ncbi:MAG: ribosome maturation factor RimM [Steroidobacteraceae bacterium]
MAPSAPAARGQDRVVLGRIGGPFGVRGWVKLISYTDPPEQILDFATWQADGKELRHLEGRRHSKGLVVRIEGVEDRNAAIALGRPELWVERGLLPALKKGEFYRADLVGFEVVNLQGQRLGSVDHFLDMPANAVMVVVDLREHWLPVGPQQVFRVDLGERRITVDWDPEF